MLCALGAALIFTACDDNPLAPSDIVGGTWRLVSLQASGSSPVVVDDPTRYTLEFGGDGRLGVKSDCNSCGSTYSLSGSSLDVEPLACTKVFCGDGSLDARFSATLEQAQRVSLDDGEMVIEGGGVTL